MEAEPGEIILPAACLRGRSDCQPLAQISSARGESFICCGLSEKGSRSLLADEFRHCWKNEDCDEMSDCDERDVKDTVSVLAQALSAKANLDESE